MNSPRKLPDAEICCTRRVDGLTWECLVEKPDCPYSIPISFSYLCRHPHRKEFDLAKYAEEGFLETG